MAFMSDNRWKFLVLIPFAALIVSALFFQYATGEIQGALLRETFASTSGYVEMLSAAIEANPVRNAEAYERNVVDSIEYVNSQHPVYASAYKFVDGELFHATGRAFEASAFEPLRYPDFVQAITRLDRGDVAIEYAPEGEARREVYLHFRWMPLYAAPARRYLVVVGVTRDSVTARVAEWVAVGQWACVAVTFALNMWLVLLLMRLGYVYDARAGVKWRSRRPAAGDIERA